MKKIIARIIVWVVMLSAFGGAFYILFIKPFIVCKDEPFFLVLIILIGMYVVIAGLGYGFYKLFEWAIDNI